MPPTSHLLTPDVIDTLRREIQDAGGTEIFAVLSRGKDDEYFNEVAVVCRGTHSEVPALVSRTKPGDMTLHNHPSGVLQPSQADMHMATLFGEEGVGSMIVDNQVTNARVIVEPSTEPIPIDVDEQVVARVFGKDGPLSVKLPDYEERPAQTQMAMAVAGALNKNRIQVIEAGTGTGKSLAYLVPALLWTRENRGRVVIATKTIALQEQLVFKDIPLARKVVTDAPHAALVKGRGNYVCRRKVEDLKTTQLQLFTDEEMGLRNEIKALANWMDSGGSGDRADLPFMPSRDAWDAVRSDADMCLGAKCPFYQKAPFYESRREAARARVLIVNQALLFSDLALRSISGNYKASAVIPPYEHIVLDEAHSIEDIATDHFGDKISSFGLRLTMGKFLGVSRANRGTLHRLFQGAVENGAMDLVRELEETFIPEFRTQQERVLGQLAALTQELHRTFNEENRKNMLLWLRPQLMESEKLNDSRDEAKVLYKDMAGLLMTLRRIRTKAGQQSDTFLEKLNGLLIEFDARMQRLEGTMAALKGFAIQPGENQIPWLELKRNRHHDEFEYRVSPLDVSPMLREALFKPFKSVVMTSATLDLDDGFKFLASRNGLQGFEDKPWSFLALKSPFDYQRQVRLYLTRLPNEPGGNGFLHDLVDLVMKSVFSPVRGGTLVLFTSYAMLNQVARQLEGPMARAGVELLVQGRDPRTRLVQRMKQSHGVLLGTDSFWEGVDLPGLALTKVIIARLPFRQMGDPVFEARCARLEGTGKSSFHHLSLPLALLKFKQGAGRLIRKADDQGYLMVADNRIRAKAYGRRFLSLIDTYPVWEPDLDELDQALIPVEAW